MNNSAKKYTLITGASSGIGYETAKAFAARGNNLILVARRAESLTTLKELILNDYSQLDIVIKSVDLTDIEAGVDLYSELMSYNITTWINNAGCGHYNYVAQQDLTTVQAMLRLNVEALAVLSTLYVKDYKDVVGAQLINISSAGGYTIVPTAVTYCASKFFVSSFTEGLAHELQAMDAKLQVKLLAPAATKTEFGNIANSVTDYNYDEAFGTYHTAKQMAALLMDLYDSNAVVGRVDRETFTFELTSPQFPYAQKSTHNQSLAEE